MARKMIVDWVGVQYRSQMGNARVVTDTVTEQAIFILDEVEAGQIWIDSSSSSSSLSSSSSSSLSSSSSTSQSSSSVDSSSTSSIDSSSSSSQSSSSSSSHSSSSSSSQSSSSSSNIHSSSSSSHSSSSSSSHSSSSSSSESSSSSSSSSSSFGGLEEAYCGVFVTTAALNGTWTATGAKYNGLPVFSRGVNSMWYDTTGYWAISKDVGDPQNQWLSSTDTAVAEPDGDIWVFESGVVTAGECSSSSSSSSQSSSSSSSESSSSSSSSPGP